MGAKENINPIKPIFDLQTQYYQKRTLFKFQLYVLHID